MANSKRKIVLNYIRDTVFANITIGNGYNNTIKTKERGILPVDKLPNSKFPALFVGGASETRVNITHNQYKGSIQALIVGYVKNSTGVSGVQEDLDDLIEDVTKAFETDRTLNNKVKWIEIKSIAVDDGDLYPFAVFAMPIDLHYTTEGITP